MLASDFRVGTALLCYQQMPKKAKLAVAAALSDPIVLPAEGDSVWLPDYMVPRIKEERLRRVLEGDDGDNATDLELVAYLMCASLNSPLDHDAVEAYLTLAANLLPPDTVRSMRDTFPFETTLNGSSRVFVEKLRSLITSGKKRHRSKEKQGRMLRTLCAASIELQCFEFLVADGRL